MRAANVAPSFEAAATQQMQCENTVQFFTNKFVISIQYGFTHSNISIWGSKDVDNV